MTRATMMVVWFGKYGEWIGGWALVAIVIALGTCGCSGRVFRVDSRFTAGEEIDIQAAADAWTTVGAQPIDFIWRSHTDLLDTDNVIVRPGERAAMSVLESAVDPTVLGITSLRSFSGTRIVLLPERMPPVQAWGSGGSDVLGFFTFRSAVTHELGHYFTGPEHGADPGDVMYPESYATKPSRNDIAALRRAEEPRP